MKIHQIMSLIGAALFLFGCASHKPELDPPQPAPQRPDEETPSPAALAAPIEQVESAVLDSCDACFPGSFTSSDVDEQACLEVIDYGMHEDDPREDDAEMTQTDMEEHKHTARLIIFDKDGEQVTATLLDEWWSDAQSSKEWSLDGTYPLCGAFGLDALVIHMFAGDGGACPEAGSESLAIYSFDQPEKKARKIWEKTGSSVSPIEYGDGFLAISYLSSDAACKEGESSFEPTQIRLECRDGNFVERPKRP